MRVPPQCLIAKYVHWCEQQKRCELDMLVISDSEGRGLVGLALEAILMTMAARRRATTVMRRWDGVGKVVAGGDRPE